VTEAELLARAGELAVTATAQGSAFAAITRSPLLIPRVRSAGGAGGRRVSAGIAPGADPAFAVLVEGGGSLSLSLFGDAVACAHAYAGELRRAARDGLAARPEAQPLTAGELLELGARLLD
jgi:hypothetical protein